MVNASPVYSRNVFDIFKETYYAKTDGEFVMEMTTKKGETYQMHHINDGNEHIFVLKPSSMSLSNGLPSLAKIGYKEIDYDKDSV